MSEEKDDSIAKEFRNLGKNLADAARAAWDNPERQRLQSEIESGLSEMGSTMRQEYEHWQESPSGQKVRKDVTNLSDRIRESDVENRVRNEMITVLHQLNQELENLKSRWTAEDEGEAVDPSSQEDNAEISENTEEDRNG